MSKKINLVWLAQCKTGFKTFTAICNSFFRSKTYNHYYRTWDTGKYIIHKVYYQNYRDAWFMETINKIKDPQYLIIIREPVKRFLSCYNFCKKMKWTNMNIEQYNEFYNGCEELCYTQPDDDYAVWEHSRFQFEYLDKLNISINDIKYVLRTEQISRDTKVLFKNLFDIDYTKNIAVNVNSNYETDKYNKDINKTIKKELEIYNLFDLSKSPYVEFKNN